MRPTRSSYVLLACTALLPLTSRSATAEAAQYAITDLGPGKAYGLNNAGRVVGTSGFSGFKWNPVTGMNRIVDPPGRYTKARGINENGTVVGNVYTSAGEHVFVWNGAVDIAVLNIIGGDGNHGDGWGINDFREGDFDFSENVQHVSPWWQGSTTCDLNHCVDINFGNGYPFGSIVGTGPNGGLAAFGPFGHLDDSNSTAFGINSHYWAVGRYRPSPLNGGWDAFLWSNSGPGVIDLTPGSGNSAAYAVNDAGIVVGQKDGEAFLYDHSTHVMNNLGTLPGKANSEALAINELGQAVGYSAQVVDYFGYSGSESVLPFTDGRAFLYDDGVMTDLNDLIAPGSYPWVLGAATGINDDGWIVGFSYDGTDFDSQPHAWLLRPLPEPADIDEDGDVDGDDLVKWKMGFGLASGAQHTQGDSNGDGKVDGEDFLIWQRQLSGPAAVGAAEEAVPEPATSMLLVLTVGCFFAVRLRVARARCSHQGEGTGGFLGN